MTPQEAIEILAPETSRKKLAEIEYYAGFNGKNTVIAKVNEACEVAVEALEKQIPNKMDYEGDGYADNGELDYDTAICRKCGRKFEIYYEEKYNYCPKCGQAIDWSENNDRI